MHTNAEITYNTIDTGNFALAEHSEIASMASLCPYEYGPPVYFARAWLRANGDTLEYANVCEMGYVSEKSKLSQLEEKSKDDIFAGFFPNPTNNGGTLWVELKEKQNAILVLQNAMGQQLMQFNVNEGRNEIHIDLRNYSQGIYYYRIITSSSQINTGKILLIK